MHEDQSNAPWPLTGVKGVAAMGEHKVIISFASAGGTGSEMPFSSSSCNLASDAEVKEGRGSLESTDVRGAGKMTEKNNC